MRSQGKQNGQRRQKEGKMHFFHLLGASASHAAFYRNESSKNIARLILITIPVSGEFRLKHRIRVRREALAERVTVCTFVEPKSFSALMSGPLTSATSTGPANCLSCASNSTSID